MVKTSRQRPFSKLALELPVVARTAIALCMMGLGALGCTPELPSGASIIESPRILAIRAEPAETTPKTNSPTDITWSTLYAGPDGEEDPSVLDWALCEERKPIATAGEISPACLVPSGIVLVDLGNGGSVTGNVPDDGCRLFGPNPPPPAPGQPPARPSDPDSTGGYYQPLRIAENRNGHYEYAVGLSRISCGLAHVSADQTTAYQERYRPNENPKLSGVVVSPGSNEMQLTEDATTTASVKTSSPVLMRASWPDCPQTPTCGDGFCGANEDKTNCPDDCTDPHGCTGSEPYVAYDPSSLAVVDRREGMRVSWYATGGTFEHDRSGRTEDQASIPSADNTWTAPDHAGDVHVWVVLRDDRGGVDWGSYLVHVE
jgi:hypothetical protein